MGLAGYSAANAEAQTDSNRAAVNRFTVLDGFMYISSSIVWF